jgi:hypothetical protein
MRILLLSAMVLAASAAAGQASAQAGGGYLGTWGFQTEDYGNDDYSATMSGVAVVTAGPSANRYSVRLLAQEQLVQQESGASRLLVAHETCTGEDAGGQLTITCQMAEPLEGYQPDSFVLQEGDDHDQLVGVLSSASNGQVTFNRVR